MHCLIIGGAGVLRPAALALLGEGHAVTASARSQASMDALAEEASTLRGTLNAIVGDYERPGALDAALTDAIEAHGRFDLALVYTAGDAPTARAALAAHPAAVTVDVLTSRHAAPGLDERARELHALRGSERSVRLLLGWTGEPGAPRWHTPAEVSAAALAAREATSGSERILGALRPWRDLPA